MTPRDELVDWLKGFDLVVDTRAGDSFADIYGLMRHLTMSLMHEAVRRAGVPVVLGSADGRAVPDAGADGCWRGTPLERRRW